MLCKFTFKGSPVFIHPASIIAIMDSGDTKTPRALVLAEEPLGRLVVDEGVAEAAAIWLTVLMWEGVADDEAPESLGD
jgi:hypothetical protein